MEEKVILERHKKREYIVWHEGKRYFWAAAKGSIISKVPVPRATYDYLAMSTNCFKNGELLIGQVNSPELVEELKEEIFEKEEQEANSLTREEVEKMLKGSIPAMKEGLEKITSETTKVFVMDIAKEIKINNATKQKALKEWFGTELPTEDLFETEE